MGEYPYNRKCPPKWAFERVEQERCAFLGLEPNPLNVVVWIADPLGHRQFHAWAAYVAKMEQPPC